jgi:formylglycine-generating enzyme required for sulfatase activity
VRAAGLVNRLLEAETVDAPQIIQHMMRFRSKVVPRLRTAKEKELDSRKSLHVSLALLPVDTGEVAYLQDRLWEAKPEEFRVICDALEPYKEGEQVRAELWDSLEDGSLTSGRRFRAACALAVFQPDHPWWQANADAVAVWLVSENPVELARWSAILQPVRNALLESLKTVFSESRKPALRRGAAIVLAEYLQKDLDQLVALSCDADGPQRQILAEKLREQRPLAIDRLQAERDRIEKETAAAINDGASEVDRDLLAQRQTRVVTMLVLLGRQTLLYPLLAHREDPRLRTYLIHEMAPSGIDPSVLINGLRRELEPSIRRALLLSLGEYEQTVLTKQHGQQLWTALEEMYRTDPDSGVHSAVEWAWRRLRNERIDAALAAEAPVVASRRRQTMGWYRTANGHTMAIVRGWRNPDSGSPGTRSAGNASDRDDDRRSPAPGVERVFAISTQEVTVRQFREYAASRNSEDPPPALREPQEDEWPVGKVRFGDAVDYCTWLDKQRGEKSALKMAGFREDGGYRLPTVAEWEYACRAGTTTRRYYGDSDSLLKHYAWYQRNADGRRLVGLCKPNDFGLFDMYGNVEEWCQSSGISPGGALRPVCGGTASSSASGLVSDSALPIHGAASHTYNGFRVAVTLVLSDNE